MAVAGVPPSRREFVAALLGGGAALALAGCRHDRDVPIAGAVLDTGMARGHAGVRDLVFTDGNLGPARRTQVAIVGAGVAGLAAAWTLRRAGITDVVVLELGDAVGGTARGGLVDAQPVPWGAHYIVAPQPEHVDLVGLLADLGALDGHDADGTPIVAEQLRCREPEERIFHRGVWSSGLYLAPGATGDDLAQLKKFQHEIDGWVSWRDGQGRRAFTLPSTMASDDSAVRELDRLSMAAWLDARGLTSPRLRWLADYACRDDFGLLAADTSAWAGIGYFASRLCKPGAEPQGVVTWPGGNSALVTRLAAGITVETGAVVVDVNDAAGSAPAPRVRLTLQRGSSREHLDADLAIVATPRFVTRRLVRGLRTRIEPAADYGAWAVANLTLRDRPRPGRHDSAPAWDNVLYDSASLGYVSATHQAGRDIGPTVWTWYYPFTELEPARIRGVLAGATHADWAEVVLSDLARAHPDLRDLVTSIDIAFWGHGMVRPRVGHRVDPSFAQRIAPVGGVHVAHTDQSGIALFEEAFAHGVRAAREVVARLRGATP